MPAMLLSASGLHCSALARPMGYCQQGCCYRAWAADQRQQQQTFVPRLRHWLHTAAHACLRPRRGGRFKGSGLSLIIAAQHLRPA